MLLYWVEIIRELQKHVSQLPMKVILGHPNNMSLGDAYWETPGDALPRKLYLIHPNSILSGSVYWGTAGDSLRSMCQ